MHRVAPLPALTGDPRLPRCVSGVSLVELIVFIVVIGVALAGVISALNVSTRASADPLTQKQALAIAEALLEEVQLRPFTFCDPDDANAARATTARLDAVVVPPQVGCAATVEALGHEGETRSGVTPFDNVNDYFVAGAGFVLTGISDLTGAAIAGLESYTATVTVAPQSLGGIAATDANGAPQSLLITVNVTGPASASVRLDGYRVRYAPNALP